MQISARADYALRALLALAAAGGGLVKGDSLAADQGLPLRFLENILLSLRRSGLVISRRGADGGYALARPASAITVADVLRATDGPLASVRGQRPETTAYTGAAENLQQVWIAVRASLREVLETVTLADIVAGTLPEPVRSRLDAPGAWLARGGTG